MRKYTNKILIITLLVGVLLVVVTGTVEIRKAYHNGEIMTVEEIREMHKDAEKVIVYTDSVVVVDKETENEQ
ncbi:MAG: hypothetical protein II856_00925 [Bacteroidales bacterium]|nr:hypothetical protein [Bacteroidales bacterium]